MQSKSAAASFDEVVEADQFGEAMDVLLTAWQVAVGRGLEADLVAKAALFSALTDLVATYGEGPVGNYTASLAGRIMAGEFTVRTTYQ
jgi:hypothetical protein